MIKNVILSTLAIAVLAGCSGKKDSDKDTSVVEAIPVKVQKLEKENIARTLDYTANLQADEQVYYAPAATGRIEKIYVEVGDRISKQAYDAAVTQYEVAKSNVDFLKENTRMLAPFNGVVTGKYFENGEVYTGAAFGGASKPSIIAIEKINPLKAYVNLSEQYFLISDEIQEGDELIVVGQGRVIDGSPITITQ